VLPFIVLFIAFTILSIGKVHLGAGHAAGFPEILAALAIILSAGGYGWLMNANDFSRYLPPDTSTKRIVWSVAIGGYVPSTLLSLLGAALYTIPSVATSGADASVFMGALFAGAIDFWLARPSVPKEAERSVVGDPPRHRAEHGRPLDSAGARAAIDEVAVRRGRTKRVGA
jgi:purine-cytosine permease-like protein